MNRTDISEKLGTGLVCDTLLLVGDKSSFLHTTETMYQVTNQSSAIKIWTNQSSAIKCQNMNQSALASLKLLTNKSSVYASLTNQRLTLLLQHTNKTKTSILRIDDVGDVLSEAPAKVSQSILLFCQGMGLLTSLSSTERLVLKTYQFSDYLQESYFPRGPTVTAAMMVKEDPACQWRITIGNRRKIFLKTFPM